MAKAKSGFSLARLENILDKTAKHLAGAHLKKNAHRKGKVGSRVALYTELSKRRNRVKTRGG